MVVELHSLSPAFDVKDLECVLSYILCKEAAYPLLGLYRQNLD